MTFEELKTSVTRDTHPEGSSPEVVALWEDARGNWDAAHHLVDSLETPTAMWVHAYLHRKEGDASNAAYWYARARRPVCSESLANEWENIARELLNVG